MFCRSHDLVKATSLPNFDRIARAYRWLEYAAFGPLLMRTRCAHLSRLGSCRRALILGDGDGRFTAALLARYPRLEADAVDSSAAMLGLLRGRVLRQCGTPARLTTYKADARGFEPARSPDLVVTHFFLDCLSEDEVATLIHRLGPRLAAQALWLVSEFRIPPGWLARPARLLLGLLYGAFRLATGLEARRLPEYDAAFARAGWERCATERFGFGLLTSELWRRRGDDFS